MNDSIHVIIIISTDALHISTEIIAEGDMIIYFCGLILNILYWVMEFIDLSSDRLLLDSFGWHSRSSLHDSTP
jgi:hypothetical protein